MSEQDFSKIKLRRGGWSEWIHPLPGFRTACCDCGLVHEWEYQIVGANETGDKPFNPGEDQDHIIVHRARRTESEREQTLRKMDEELARMLSQPGLIPYRWMVSPPVLKLISGDGLRLHSYRGIRIDEHDEWSWGWMLRSSDGRFVTKPRDSDGSPKGEKPKALSAQHDSAGRSEAKASPTPSTPSPPVQP